MILAIDPGAKGALAFFDPKEGTLEIFDMPTVQVKRGNKLKTEVSPQLVASIVANFQPTKAVIEKVGAMPGQGVSSMWQFGRSVGIMEGVIAAKNIPIEYVTPQRWMKDMRVRDGKDGSRLRAMELFPAYADRFKRVKDDGRSDAALIAYHASIT